MKSIFLFLVLSFNAFGSTIRIPEQALADGLKFLLSLHHKGHPTTPAENWGQLAEVAGGFEGLNSTLKSGSVVDYFTFIPLGSRDRFPGGRLILVQIRPMPWPDAWKTKDPENFGEYREHHSHQDIRFLIYEKNGKFIAERWYEAKFQAMLAETGLTVPPPTPYYPPPPMPPGEKPAPRSEPAAPMASARTAAVSVSTTVPTPALVVSPPAKSSGLLWWIVGAIVVLAAVVLVVRRKKSN
jgi:hypothetical protein